MEPQLTRHRIVYGSGGLKFISKGSEASFSNNNATGFGYLTVGHFPQFKFEAVLNVKDLNQRELWLQSYRVKQEKPPKLQSTFSPVIHILITHVNHMEI